MKTQHTNTPFEWERKALATFAKREEFLLKEEQLRQLHARSRELADARRKRRHNRVLRVIAYGCLAIWVSLAAVLFYHLYLLFTL